MENSCAGQDVLGGAWTDRKSLGVGYRCGLARELTDGTGGGQDASSLTHKERTNALGEERGFSPLDRPIIIPTARP